jgi:hypothetical protein
VHHHAAQAQLVVLDSLTIVERGEVELPIQLLCHHLLHAVVADPHGHDHVLGLLDHLLLDNHRYHLQWYRTAQCVKHHYLLLLIGAVVLDDALESSCL